MTQRRRQKQQHTYVKMVSNEEPTNKCGSRLLLRSEYSFHSSVDAEWLFEIGTIIF